MPEFGNEDDRIFFVRGLRFGRAALLFCGLCARSQQITLRAWTLRILKWILGSTLSLALAVGGALFIGTLAYQLRNACDDMTTSPLVQLPRKCSREADLQACTFVGTVENYYITIRMENARLRRTRNYWKMAQSMIASRSCAGSTTTRSASISAGSTGSRRDWIKSAASASSTATKRSIGPLLAIIKRWRQQRC